MVEKYNSLCIKFNVPIKFINELESFGRRLGYTNIKLKKFTTKSGIKKQDKFYIYSKKKKLGSAKFTTYDFSNIREKLI